MIFHEGIRGNFIYKDTSWYFRHSVKAPCIVTVHVRHHSIWCHSVKPSVKALCDDIPCDDKDTTCVKALHEMSQLHEICLVNQHAAETGQRQGGMTYCSHPTRQSLRTEESQHLGDYFPSQPAMLSIPLRVIGSDSHQAYISTLLPF